jgi:hypothetical protein
MRRVAICILSSWPSLGRRHHALVVDILAKLVVVVCDSNSWPEWDYRDSAADTLALTCMLSLWLSWVRRDSVVRNTCESRFLLNGSHHDSAVHNLADPWRTIYLRTRVRSRRRAIRSKVLSRTQGA